MKHISRRVADTLYAWRDRFYLCFTDLLYDMEMHPAFDSQVMEILIRLGYFQEFGSSGKLLRMLHEFREGEFRFSKSHIPSTQETRLAILRRLEAEMVESDIPLYEQIAFEITMCGAPMSTGTENRSEYAVLEVDDRYSAKVRLYSLSTGRIGVMKIKKGLYKAQPLEVGSILRLHSWERKPSFRYQNGRAIPDLANQELWATAYEKISCPV